MSLDVQWVNADLLRMAANLEVQADAVSDIEDTDGSVRAKIYRAAAYLRLSFAELLTVPPADVGVE